MSKSQIETKYSEVSKVPFWWHSIDLGDGVITPGQTSMEAQERRVAAIPERIIRGKRLLDIGCWDGFFSFWCEKRGVKVIPIDNFQYKGFVQSKYDIKLKGGEGFRVAAQCLGSELTLLKKDFTDVKGKFDIVLFFGILYHQRNPFLALEHLSRLTHEYSIIETHYIKGENDPIMRFYPGSTLNSDPTNYWGPSIKCVEIMLKEVGFKKVDLVDTYWDNDDRAIFTAYK